MYIIKNARKGITRAKGRSIRDRDHCPCNLAVCLYFSFHSVCIRSGSRGCHENLKITAQIGIDREAMMQGKDSKEDKKKRWKVHRI